MKTPAPRLFGTVFLAAFAWISAVHWMSNGSSPLANAGIGGGFQQQAVGGVMIDAGGVIRTATEDERARLADIMRRQVRQADGDLAKVADTRVVSLAALQAAIRDAEKANRPLTDDIIFLAGLQKIDYILVDSENNDVCIAGPAEPWKVTDDGSVVGVRSGLSPLRLIDLMVAFQTVEAARDGGISCSIEPTAEGRRKLQLMLRRTKLSPGQDPRSVEPAMRRAFGPQMIRLNNAPEQSRLARTMVAADYEMKRIAMGLAESPVAGLPSYIEIARNKVRNGSQNPRWWMACDYDAVAHDEEGRIWQFSGNRVRTLTETDLIDRDGNATAGGTKDAFAEKWAKLMTEKYDELAVQIPVFADLENMMDVAVASTLIVQEGLDQKVGLDLTTLMQPSDHLQIVSYAIPKSVDPQCSFIRAQKGWVVTASGGVDISGFPIVDNQQVSKNLNGLADKLTAGRTKRWWWDVSANL